MTCGPYRPITLSVLDVSISHVNTRALVAADLSRKLKIDVELYIDQPSKDVLKNLELSFVLKKHGNPKPIAEMRVGNCDFETIPGPEDITTVTIESAVTCNFGNDDGQVKLWWPVGYGEQALYDVEVELFGDSGSEVS